MTAESRENKGNQNNLYLVRDSNKDLPKTNTTTTLQSSAKHLETLATVKTKYASGQSFKSLMHPRSVRR